MSDDGYFGLISAEADRWASSFMADRKIATNLNVKN
jgi:hypothetical protein